MLTVSLPRAELVRRAAEAHELLGERCVVCPRGCKVDRRADVPGLCAIGRHAVVASYFPHFGEEDCLRGRRGSGTIFFSGCNLRCVFCMAPGSLVSTEHGPKPIDEIFSEGLDEIGVGDGRVRRPGGVRVHTVDGEDARYDDIARSIHREEYEQSLALARELGLRLDPRSVADRRRLAHAV